MEVVNYDEDNEDMPTIDEEATTAAAATTDDPIVVSPTVPLILEETTTGEARPQEETPTGRHGGGYGTSPHCSGQAVTTLLGPFAAQ